MLQGASLMLTSFPVQAMVHNLHPLQRASLIIICGIGDHPLLEHKKRAAEKTKSYFKILPRCPFEAPASDCCCLIVQQNFIPDMTDVKIE